MKSISIDFEAVRRAVLAELHRQGVEFAKVKVRNYPSETHLIVEAYTEDTLNPKYVDSTRVARQLERVIP